MADAATSLVFVALGGAIGALGRFFVSGLIGRWLGETFPWGTFAVNVLGSLAIGAAAGAGDHLAGAWLFAVVGVLGSFTTVSSFSLQTLALAQAGEPARAALNCALSVSMCLGAAATGFSMTFGG
jgi:CrcB protein